MIVVFCFFLGHFKGAWRKEKVTDAGWGWCEFWVCNAFFDWLSI